MLLNSMEENRKSYRNYLSRIKLVLGIIRLGIIFVSAIFLSVLEVYILKGQR